MKNQHDLAVRTHYNGHIQHCMLHIHHEASKANLHFHGKSTRAILFACTDVSFPETAMTLFSLNAIETHLSTTSLKLCLWPALDMQCLFSTSVSGSLEAGGSQRHWVAAWHSKSSYHVDLLQSRKTSLPRVFTTHFLLVNRRSGLTPILK